MSYLLVLNFNAYYWNIEQAIAWIAFHDLDLVEAISADILPKARPYGFNGHIFFNQTTLGKYMAGSDPRSEKWERHRTASQELRSALQRGEVVASNRATDAEQRTTLGKLYWIDHQFYFDITSGVYRTEIPGQKGENKDEVRFDSNHIKERWPAQSDPVAQKRSAEEMAYGEFYQVMKASPHKRTRTKDPWIKELVVKFPGLTPTAAKNEWRQATKDAGAEAWTWSGRPPKKP